MVFGRGWTRVQLELGLGRGRRLLGLRLLGLRRGRRRLRRRRFLRGRLLALELALVALLGLHDLPLVLAPRNRHRNFSRASRAFDARARPRTSSATPGSTLAPAAARAP